MHGHDEPDLYPIPNETPYYSQTQESRIHDHAIQRLRIGQPVPDYRVSDTAFDSVVKRTHATIVGAERDETRPPPFIELAWGTTSARVYAGGALMDDNVIVTINELAAEMRAGARPTPPPTLKEFVMTTRIGNVKVMSDESLPPGQLAADTDRVVEILERNGRVKPFGLETGAVETFRVPSDENNFKYGMRIEPATSITTPEEAARVGEVRIALLESALHHLRNTSSVNGVRPGVSDAECAIRAYRALRDG